MSDHRRAIERLREIEGVRELTEGEERRLVGLLRCEAEDAAELAAEPANEHPAYSAESFRGLDRRLTSLVAPDAEPSASAYGEMQKAGGEAELASHPLDCDCKPAQAAETIRSLATQCARCGMQAIPGTTYCGACGGDVGGIISGAVKEKERDDRRSRIDAAAEYLENLEVPRELKRQRDELANEIERLKTRQEAHVRIINAIAERLGLPEGSSDEDAEDAIRSLQAEIDTLAAALKQIRSLGGNLSDERLTGRTGANDAVARGLMYTEARRIAEAALRAAGRL